MTLPPQLETALAAAFTPENVASNAIQQHEWELRTFLRIVIDELKPARTVELGSYLGWTSALLSLVTYADTVSIDNGEFGTPGEAARYGYHLTFLLGDAADPPFVKSVMANLGGPIDLLFIDDGHYYETIALEFKLWRPHVRPGGWIVFHDINPLANIGPHGTQPDSIQVPRFWKELQGEKQEIIATQEHVAWKGVIPHGGLGILRV